MIKNYFHLLPKEGFLGFQLNRPSCSSRFANGPEMNLTFSAPRAHRRVGPAAGGDASFSIFLIKSKKLNTRKAPDLNGINKKAIECPSLLLMALVVAIFNACLKNCYFPPVWKEAIIYDRLILIIHSYINDREFTFRTKNTYSSKRPIRVGVPQDSTLSPLLYSAYTNKMTVLRPQTRVQLVLFADNMTLYLRSCSVGNIIPHLQRIIDELTQRFQLWRIEVNQEKNSSNLFRLQYEKQDSSSPGKHHHPPHVKCSHSVAKLLQIK
ncbi:RNA-directed DNA polymerase from mobile element jockey [Eumeta japonica]|uniref:RNA-directed DNA polymerase from mobile element jockey n=1 Tax=Eumeta variegata TaxID=151549 RepID=A0A4C1Y3F9_EUMVA|nr:RNA-directed DNA polymerase from mobile element jockey [Eumeta japonica]